MSGSLGEAVLDLAADGTGLMSDINKARPKALSALSNLGRVGGMLLAAGITLAAVAIVGITALIWNSANTLDAAYDNIQTKTGATGERLDALKEDFKAVFQNVPADAQSVSDAVAGLNQRLGLTGPVLQDTSTRLLEMTRITGGDLQTNLDAFTRLMGDAGIANEDAAKTLDTVYAASTNTGIGVDRLMELMVQFGAPMRAFGFSFEESAAMLGKWEKEGVNTELVMGSLRVAAGNFARDNIPLREGLENTFDAIKNAEDGSSALAIAMDVFGARAGPDMAAAIREGRFELGDLVDILGDSEGAIEKASIATMDWGERLQMFKNRVTVAFEASGQKLMDAASEIIDAFVTVFERPDVQAAIASIAGWIGDIAGKIADAIPEMIDNFFKFVEWLKQNKPIVVGVLAALGVAILAFGITVATAAWTALAPLLPVIAIMALVGAAAYLLYRAWTENWGGIQQKAQAVWAVVQPFLQNLWVWLQTNLPIAIQALSNFWTTTLLPAIQAVGQWISANLVPIFMAIWNWMSVNIPAAIRSLSAFWASLQPPIAAVVGWMQGTLFPFFSALANFLSAVAGVAVKAFAWVWQNALQPALAAVAGVIGGALMGGLTKLSGFFNGTLMPIIKTVAKFVGGVLVAAFNTLSGVIKKITTALDNMAEALSNIELPANLTPGSPTPFEVGLWGIHKALRSVAGLSLPTISAQMQVSAAGFSTPAYATASMGMGAGTGGGSGSNTFYAPVTFEVKDKKGFDELMRTLRK